MIVNNTPVQRFLVSGREVWVKREDLCTESPGPPFSKCRGLYAHLKRLYKSGIRVVGYVETPISMAGWGVAWLGQKLNMKVVIFDPQYVGDPPSSILIHRKRWKEFHPTIVPVKAGRTCINQHYAKQWMEHNYPGNGMVLPTGIPSKETVSETALEWFRTEDGFHPDCVVVCVGSGTICAGLLKGMEKSDVKLIGVMAYGSNDSRKLQEIYDKAGLHYNGFFACKLPFRIYNPNYEYTEAAEGSCPFPCHSYYDLKAWRWLVDNLDKLNGKVLFWNIGSEAL